MNRSCHAPRRCFVYVILKALVEVMISIDSRKETVDELRDPLCRLVEEKQWMKFSIGIVFCQVIDVRRCRQL
jgi:hypothetical protein